MPAEGNSFNRARRFRLRLPLKYRAAGELRWRRAVTENVSCSGVLLRGCRVSPAASLVELLLPVPRQLAGDARLLVLCRGRIARVAPRRIPFFANSVGVRVLDYELVRAEGTQSAETRHAPQAPEIIHDLNNMLAVVIGCSELILSDDGATSGCKRYAGSIQSAAQRAAQLVQQFMQRGAL